MGLWKNLAKLFKLIDWSDAATLIGLALFSYGFYLIFPPLLFIVLGAGLSIFGIWSARIRGSA